MNLEQTLESISNFSCNCLGKPGGFIERSSSQRMEYNIIHDPEPGVCPWMQLEVCRAICSLCHCYYSPLQGAVHWASTRIVNNVWHERVSNPIVGPVLELFHDDGIWLEPCCSLDRVECSTVSRLGDVELAAEEQAASFLVLKATKDISFFSFFQLQVTLSSRVAQNCLNSLVRRQFFDHPLASHATNLLSFMYNI